MLKINGLFKVCLLFMAALVVTACGGSSSGADTSPDSDLETMGTGSVTVMVTDGPSDDFDQIWLTVNKVELLGEDGKVTVFEGEKTFDLLKLKNFSAMLSSETGIPVGTYSKIRLLLAEIELIRLNENGEVEESIKPKLPGKGKLDLNPRGEFQVAVDKELILLLDIDAEKAIHISKKSKKVSFRPVVFVKILEADDISRLVRVHGHIDEINEDNTQMRLCDLMFTELRVNHSCLFIKLDEDTSIFDNQAESMTADLLDVDQQVTIVGRSIFRLTGSNDSEECEDDDCIENEDERCADERHRDHDHCEDMRWVLKAALIQAGDMGTFAHLTGTAVDEPLEATDSFSLMLNEGQAFADETQLQVQLQSDTKVFSRNGKPLDFESINEGAALAVDGILFLSDEDPDFLKSTLVILDELVLMDKLRGTLKIVDDVLYIVEDEMERCLSTDDDSEIYAIKDDASDEISEAELQNGWIADVYGKEMVNGCFNANRILAFVDEELEE